MTQFVEISYISSSVRTATNFFVLHRKADGQTGIFQMVHSNSVGAFQNVQIHPKTSIKNFRKN